MEKLKSVDMRVKVVHKAKETTKLVFMNQAGADVLVQFKRLVVESFPDLAPNLRPDHDSVRLEYRDTEGDYLLIDDDDTLRSAIAELNGGGQVPKFWASYSLQANGKKAAASGQESGVLPPPALAMARREERMKSEQFPSASSNSSSWAADKANRLRASENGNTGVPTAKLWASSQAALALAPCKFHAQPGGCRHGADCRYLHARGAGLGSSGEQTAVSREAARAGCEVPTAKVWASSHAAQGLAPRKFDAQPGGCRNGAGCRYLQARGAGLGSSGEQTALSREAARAGWEVKANARSKNRKLSLGPAGDVLPLSMDQLRYWLQQQLEQPASTNIKDLSGEDSEDHKIFVGILERRNLSEPVVDRLVELLTKEETRSSMLRHQTNRIYGLLIGSPFMVQLQSQIQGLVNPKPWKVHMYVRLMEEIQGRTADGWKEVPLDAIKRVVDDMVANCNPSNGIEQGGGSDSAKDTALDELVADVNRLLEQRDNSKRLRAVSTANYSSQGEEVLRLPILPSKAEMMISDTVSRQLPVNLVGRRFSSVVEYLGTHFQLLREDYIEPLRQGINAYKKQNLKHAGDRRYSSEDHDQDLNIYINVRFMPGLLFGREGIQRQVEFTIPAGRDVNWEHSKRLMFGSLLCFSEDEFHTFFWALVVGRDVKELAKGRVNVRLITESEIEAHKSGNSEEDSPAAQEEPSKPPILGWFEPSQKYVMVESASAYFEAYAHVLRSLQREDMCEQLVFTKHLIDLEPKVGPPSYLARRPQHGEFNFRTVFPELLSEIGKDSFDILTSWPEWKNCALDDSQKKALKHGLTKELALIQGPPGTGKTYVGLLLVKALLANLKAHAQESELSKATISKRDSQDTVNNQDVPGPILVVCYTNHALDQFLLGIYEFEKNLVRIGGRSKNKDLMSQTLTKLVFDQKQARCIDRSHHRASRAAKDEKKKFELTIEQNFLPRLNLMFVERSALRGIATPEQVQSLFQWENPASPDLDPEEHLEDEDIVKIWLKGSEVDFLNAACKRKTRGAPQRQINMAQILSVNRFDVIQDEDEDDEAALAMDDPYDTLSIDSDEEYLGNQSRFPPELQEIEEKREPTLGAEIGENTSESDADLEEGLFQAEDDANDVWKLPTVARLLLHEYWLAAIKKDARDQIERLSAEYEEACKQSLEVQNEIQLSLLRQAKVVGMTTTAGARLHDLMVSLRPTIVVVEEAAEVLESSVLACLSPHTKHLILIGDHQQLRPFVSVHKLAMTNKLDVSLFERLVTSGVEFRRLEVQRRMRANISQLVQSIYRNLRDHPSVLQYSDVTGVKTNVFFLDHKAEESSSRILGTGSKVNKEEAAMVVELCVYLLNQGHYTPANITILSMYSGQVHEIKRLLHTRIEARWPTKIIAAESKESDESEETEGASGSFPRVSSVDDFQGEESDIILLSLVRSNHLDDKDGPGKIGFLNIANRVCVAISRARIGLYMFGNAELLAAKSPPWRKLIGTLAESHSVGSHLTLCCQNHPGKETRVSGAIDYKQVADGGCSRPCEFQLPCGHVCPRRCHPGKHDVVACIKPCLRRYGTCEHTCTQGCHAGSDCPPCVVRMVRDLPKCGHKQVVACSDPVDKVLCRERCAKLLRCGHPCPNNCGQPCLEVCSRSIQSTLPCGHPRTHLCCEDPASLVCKSPCRAILEGCNHECKGSCGECKQGRDHIPCKKPGQRLLPCGHDCEDRCSAVCPPCQKPCQKRCVHSSCSLKCGEPCVPCMERCAWRCRHYRCDLLCHETCSRPRCDRRCNRKIKCGHRCSGICGEPCPKKCKTCHGDTLDIISQMKLEEMERRDKIIELQDCKHVFEVSGLDSWMDQDDTQTVSDAATATRTAIKLKQCPQCRTPVRRSYRYANVVKKALEKIEAVKRVINGYEHCKLGDEALIARDPTKAIQLYQQALKYNPSLPQSHLGIGCAFAAKRAFATASYHFQYLAHRSTFRSHPAVARAAKAGVAESKEDVEYYKIMFQSSTTSSTATVGAEGVKAMVHWASMLTKMNEFDRATQLCDAVLSQDPGDEQAQLVKQAASVGQIQEVVAAVSVNLPGSGHWYECPNGHVYAIGECGGPMETARCPDCNAVIGGHSHMSAPGNVHSRVDGSTAPAWGNRTGLGNFRI